MVLSRRSILVRNCGNSKRLVAFLALLLVLEPFLSTHAYADWLKCYVDLDDEDEIIMHKPIVKVEDQSEEERKVVIEIQPYISPKNSPWMASTVQEYGDLFPASNAPTPTSLLKARLRLTPNLQQQKSKSVQFAMVATGEGVSFVGRGAVCNGSRVSSKKHDEHVLLQIHDGLTTTENIELVAAWAGGYEAVKVTQKLIVKRSTSSKRNIRNKSGDEL